MNELIQSAIGDVFAKCCELTELTGRPFSPDGHLVGSLGEVYAAEALNLRLMPPSNRGFDAIDDDDQKVEIKATTRASVALSSKGTAAQRLVVISFASNGDGTIVYDGPAEPAWAAAGKPQANGQRQISLSTLRSLQSIHDDDQPNG